MGKTCKHYVDRGGWFSSSEYCNVSGIEEKIPYSYVKDFCGNDGYKCPWYEKEYGSSGGCFITTITCGILGKSDNDPVMEGLRKFRDEILQKQDKYSNILKIYDTIGPRICCNINHDETKTEKAEMLYSKLGRFVESLKLSTTCPSSVISTSYSSSEDTAADADGTAGKTLTAIAAAQTADSSFEKKPFILTSFL